MSKNLKQIIFSHHSSFTANLIKTMGKREGIEVYILDDLSDFGYLLEDLTPEVFLIDERNFSEDVYQQLIPFESTLSILIREEDSQQEYSYKNLKEIQGPIAPEKLFEQVRDLC